MNKFSKINFILLFLLLAPCSLLFGFVVVSAQEAGATKFNLETGVEAGAKAGAVRDDIELTYPWSGAEKLGDLVSRFYNIALGLVGVAALAAIIYGGILWTVSKSPSGSQEAKDWITGAIWGLLLLLSAYLLFNTIGIIKEGRLVEPGIPELPTSPREESLTEAQKAERNKELLDDTKTKDYLSKTSSARISFNKRDACAASFDRDCTSMSRMPENAIDGLLRIVSDKGCDCAVVVTGGTEKYGHATHGPDKPIVDLRYKQAGKYGVNTALLEYLNKQTGVSLLKNQDKDIPAKDGSMTVRFETNKDGSQHFHIIFK
jgi:hypothetical protein